MPYIDDNLGDGESVIYRTTLHWVVSCEPIIGGLFSWCFALSVLRLASWGGWPELRILAAGLFLVGGLIALTPFIAISTSEFGITTHRVMIKVGLLHTRTLEMLLPQVESISVDQTLIGRLLGYGTLVVRGVSGMAEPFPQVKNVFEFRKKVQEQIEKAK